MRKQGTKKPTVSSAMLEAAAAMGISEAAIRHVLVSGDLVACYPASRVQLLTIPEAADCLHVDRSTIYRLIASGDLAVTDVSTGKKSGKAKSRIREDELVRFIEARTRTATVPACPR